MQSFKFYRLLKCITSTYLLLVACSANSQNCQSPELEIYHQQLQKYIISHKPQVALIYSDSVLQIIEAKGLEHCQKSLWIQLERGEIYEINNNFEEALELYYQIARLAEKQAWWNLLAHTHISIARCYESVNRPFDCKRQLTFASALISQHELHAASARFALRNASYHRMFDNIDSARIYVVESIRLGHKYQVPRSVFDGHLLMGILSQELDTAIFHFNMAISMFEERGNYHGAASQTINICLRLINAGRLQEALNILDNAARLLNKMEQHTIEHYSLLNRSHKYHKVIYEQLGNIDSAFHHQTLAHAYEKKATTQVNLEAIQANAVEFAIQKEKEKSLYLQRVSTLLRRGLFALGLTLLMFAFLLHNNFKKRKILSTQSIVIKQQNEQLEQALHKQSILLSEVHHRVKNNLQLIISLLTLQKREDKSKNLNEFRTNISNKVRSIALIHEQLYSSGEFENIDTQAYFSLLINNFGNLQNEHVQALYDIQTNNISLSLETVMPLGIICAELIGNSIKYAALPNQNLHLRISLHQKNNKYELRYADNGPGISEQVINSNRKKMGLKLINAMVRQLQAESRTYNDQGARFTMIFVEKKTSKI